MARAACLLASFFLLLTITPAKQAAAAGAMLQIATLNSNKRRIRGYVLEWDLSSLLWLLPHLSWTSKPRGSCSNLIAVQTSQSTPSYRVMMHLCTYTPHHTIPIQWPYTYTPTPVRQRYGDWSMWVSTFNDHGRLACFWSMRHTCKASWWQLSINPVMGCHNPSNPK